MCANVVLKLLQHCESHSLLNQKNLKAMDKITDLEEITQVTKRA